MSTLISGSIAYDTVFTHEGRFADTLKTEALDTLNITLQAATMRKTFGGCAANIAYALKQLAGDPLIWTAVGRDADPILQHLTAARIRTDGITVLPDAWTAQCVITTDLNECQFATFHPGAMDLAGGIPWPADTDKDADISLAILAPSCRSTVFAHLEACRAHGVPILFDPGQTTPLLSGEELLAFVDASVALAVSDYEALMIEEKTGFTPAELSRRTTAVFCTHGGKGASVWQQGRETLLDALPVEKVIDPVGAGDAFRGGLLWAYAEGLDPVEAAIAGTMMGATKVSCAGPHYMVDLEAVETAVRTKALIRH